MRIIGEIEGKGCKISVFKTDMRLIVKFEDSFYEQIFKFRQSEELKGVEDIQRLIDEPFMELVRNRFVEMRQATEALWARFMPPAEWEEDII